jgi:hypothetical protein
MYDPSSSRRGRPIRNPEVHMNRLVLASIALTCLAWNAAAADGKKVLFSPEEFVACREFTQALEKHEAGTQDALAGCAAEGGTEELCQRRLLLRLDRCGDVLQKEATFQQMSTQLDLAGKYTSSRLRRLGGRYKEALRSTQEREATGDVDATIQGLLEIYDVYWLVSWSSAEAAAKMNESLRTDAEAVGLRFDDVDAYVTEALAALRAAKARGDFTTIEAAIQTQRVAGR